MSRISDVSYCTKMVIGVGFGGGGGGCIIIEIPLKAVYIYFQYTLKGHSLQKGPFLGDYRLAADFVVLCLTVIICSSSAKSRATS